LHILKEKRVPAWPSQNSPKKLPLGRWGNEIPPPFRLPRVKVNKIETKWFDEQINNSGLWLATLVWKCESNSHLKSFFSGTIANQLKGYEVYFYWYPYLLNWPHSPIFFSMIIGSIRLIGVSPPQKKKKRSVLRRGPALI